MVNLKNLKKAFIKSLHFEINDYPFCSVILQNIITFYKKIFVI